ncbi:hypothetical protein PC110_g20137 [Phytophthora cactorum]|nr:hypothetical protein PC110_g20137 [Phytophthora cactorum]
MGSAIEERNPRANVKKNDAPGCTVNDLCVLVQYLIMHADIATGLKPVYDAALLTVMWHTFVRTIDTCFARKHQLSVAASGELFLNIARIKTSVVQGVSIYKAPERWQQGMVHALGVLFVCCDEPSEYRFPLVPRYAKSELPGGHTYTQEEVIIYWESLDVDSDIEARPAAKRERKHPNAAIYITEVIRGTVKEMPSSTSRAISRGQIHWIASLGESLAYAAESLRNEWLVVKGNVFL